MQQCKPGIAPVCKGDKLSLSHCPHSDIEKAQMKNVPYLVYLGVLCMLKYALGQILPLQ